MADPAIEASAIALVDVALLTAPITENAAARTGTMEMIPKWLNLVPMVLQWAWLSLRYGSATLPSAANPGLTAGGLVGDTKSEYFRCMGSHALTYVAPFAMITANGASALESALAAMRDAGVGFPVVAKPDLGWCGYGVRRVDDEAALADYLARFPSGESVMLQRYLDEPGEAGIFYVRHPDAPCGHLLGVLLRYYPQVVGDGLSSMAQLVARDPRLRHAVDNPLHECRFDGDAVPAVGSRRAAFADRLHPSRRPLRRRLGAGQRGAAGNG